MKALESVSGAAVVTVTDAAAKGLPAIVREAEGGADVVVTRRGEPVAYVLGVGRVAELSRLEADLRDAALVLTRAATDSGERSDLDDVIASFGFTRAELEAELRAELAGS